MRHKNGRLALGAGVALALAGVAVAAVAQPPPPPGARERTIVRPDGLLRFRGHDGRMIRRTPEDRAERLRTLLQLTPGQEGALRAFVAATAPPEPHAFMQPSADGHPSTAVERADRAAEAAGRVAAEAKKRADATRAFYAALTPSQRKVFDTEPGAGMVMRIHDRGGPGMRPPTPPMPPAPPPPGSAG